MGDFDYRAWNEKQMRDFWERIRGQVREMQEEHPDRFLPKASGKQSMILMVVGAALSIAACFVYGAAVARMLFAIIGAACIFAGAVTLFSEKRAGRVFANDTKAVVGYGVAYAALIVFGMTAAVIALAGHLPVIISLTVVGLASVAAWGCGFCNSLVESGI